MFCVDVQNGYDGRKVWLRKVWDLRPAGASDSFYWLLYKSSYSSATAAASTANIFTISSYTKVDNKNLISWPHEFSMQADELNLFYFIFQFLYLLYLNETLITQDF